MKAYPKFAERLLGRFFRKPTPALARLQLKLFRAHRAELASTFLATLTLTGVLAGALVALLAAVVLLAVDAPFAARILFPPIAGLLVGASAFGTGYLLIESEASEHAKEIDANLPQALTYMLTLANAGLPPKAIWASLAQQPVFGALRYESERIHRDLDVFGHDILKALRTAQDRTPSRRFREFLQGAISAFHSGVELAGYLKAKDAQYRVEEESVQYETMETIGILAEAYLVVVVAAPLFMIILLTVMSTNQGPQVIKWGYGLVLGIIPLSQAGIGAIIRSMNPPVWN